MVVKITRFLTIAMAYVALAGTAKAAFFSGDPVTDAWTGSGNSQAKGNYIRGSADFNFDMYRIMFLVSSASGLSGQTGWASTDIVLGMGGVVATPTTAPVVNANLTTSVRIVSKYAALVAPGYTPSTTTTTPGDGLGNHMAGDGGNGSVLISTAIGAITSGGAASLQVPDFRFQYDATMPNTNGNALLANVARFVYTVQNVNGVDLLKSWEVLLNISNLPDQAHLPSYAANWDQALQRGTKKFTDGLNSAPTPPPPSVSARRSFIASDFEDTSAEPAIATPLPPTLVALVAGAGLLGLGRRLRRRA